MARLGSGTVAVVTGAANGIGRALARELHARGAVAALVDVDDAGLTALAAELRGSSVHVCDVADAGAVDALRGEVLAAHGRVHVVMNNAGIAVAGSVEDIALEHFHRAMDVNFWGVVHLCRAFAPALREAAARGETAAIANVLSDFALFSLPTKAPYAASKHAARALTEALGAELFDSGVSVTAVVPGATATGLLRRGYAVDDGKRLREAEFLAKGIAPEIVARRIADGIERRRVRVLIGRDTRAIDAAARLAPALLQAGVRRLWRKVPFL